MILPLVEPALPPTRAPVLQDFRTKRHVLIVSPHFAPVNAPDQHRARMMLSHLGEFGWTAEVLTVAPEFVDAPIDSELEAALPAGVKIHRVAAIPYQWTRPWGWGSLARRAYGNLRRRGDELLATGRFDLSFFSTTQFGVLSLGRYWQKRWSIPYVLDFHDEWAGDYYEQRPGVRPPGGRLKYGLSRAFAGWQENRVVPHAAQIISVSARYNERLRQRHPSMASNQFHVLPFGGAESDFDVLCKRRFPHAIFKPQRGTHWVYAGRGGPAMETSARAFFLALRRAIHRHRVPEDLQVHFIGTDYATGSRAKPTFLPLAAELGIEDWVTEQTARVPHFMALQCLRDAAAIVVMGSDDAGYTASKLLPCLMARRPLLGIFHEGSSCVSLLRETKAGTVVPFACGEDPRAVAERIDALWFEPREFERAVTFSGAVLEPYSARAMTQQLAAIFDVACRPVHAAT